MLSCTHPTFRIVLFSVTKPMAIVTPFHANIVPMWPACATSRASSCVLVISEYFLALWYNEFFQALSALKSVISAKVLIPF